jgi:hypothetical protein
VSHTPSDDSFDRLHRAGWSVGHVGLGPEHARVWLVTGSNGENRVEARGRTLDEAYWPACEQASAVGMSAPPRRALPCRGARGGGAL